MTIRPIVTADAQRIKIVYQHAFAGYPWFEDLSEDEVGDRWSVMIEKPGFSGLVAEVNDMAVGATWYDQPTIDGLAEERGSQLADFVRSLDTAHRVLVWVRETVVHPAFQGKGIARRLKAESVKGLVERPCVLLTRMRSNNHAIIKLNRDQGMMPTGITLPCSLDNNHFHEYWYQLLDGS